MAVFLCTSVTFTLAHFWKMQIWKTVHLWTFVLQEYVHLLHFLFLGLHVGVNI